MNFGSEKDEIRQTLGIVDVVGGDIPLHRQGRIFVGLCPFHKDTKPSLQVNPDRQTWKCWPCNKGGDIFSWMMEHHKLEFVEAMRMLAERAGVELKQYTPAKPIQPGSPDDKVTLLQAAAWAEQQFHDYLLKADGAEVARHYLEDRGITQASIEQFRIGYCPENWNWLCDRARGTQYSPAVLEAAGVATKKEWGYSDFYTGRVIFPIRDTQSRPIAFGGRVLPNSAIKGGKYINGRDTKLFNKSEQLYALDIASKAILSSKSNHLTIVEGFTDVILCHQFGVNDVVACLGVAVGERHLPILRRFANSVTLLLDGDEAGQRNANRILELFVTAGMDLRILTLPEEFDPAEFLLERGAAPFQQLLREQAVDALEHKIRVATKDLDIARDTHRASIALEDILSTLARGAAAGGLDTKSLRTQQLLARLARQFLLNESDVRERFVDLIQTAKQPARIVQTVPSTAPEIEKPRPEFKLSAISMDELELLEILVAHHDHAGTVLSELGELDLQADATKLIFRTYRHLEEAGESLDFGRVLAEVEEPTLKNLLVQIVEVADRKASKANQDPSTRLRQLLTKINRGHEQRIIREKQAFLQQAEANEQEKHDVFLEIFEAKRRQQGIIAPTEG